MELRQRPSRRGGLAVAALSIALLAGCGSTVEPSAERTIGPIHVGMGAPPQASTTPVTAPSSGTAGGHPTLPSVTSPATTGVSTAPGVTTTPTGTQSTHAPVQTGPITVGFLTTATTNASQYGGSLGNTVNETTVDQALINAIDKQGGLDGRQLKVIFAHTDTGSTNWDNDFEAACQTFTQDHHVDVVLGYEFNYEPDFESCLAQQGIPHLDDGFNVPSSGELAKYPLFWSLDVPTIGQRSIEKFQGAINTGFLTSKNKLGILLDSCPGTQDAWNGQVLPFLKSHHIDVATTFTASCNTGNNAGATSAIGSLTSGLLKFRSAGVDRISFVAVSEAPVLYLASVAANAQGYRPGWIVSSLGQLAIIGGESPMPQMQNTRGFGWLPSQDVPPAYAPKKNAAQSRCISLLASQKVYPRSAADYGYAYNACEAVFVYEKALKLDGGNSDGQAISNAIGNIGSFQSTLNLEGKSVFSSARRNDAPQVYKPINWDGGCHCFRYGSQTYPMPS
ncbi:MAG TPA: hypothetical protein VHW74_15575 [Mycobacteriales bacterium]|nr:hypothetical protein [Mycobacteriales bacterium]